MGPVQFPVRSGIAVTAGVPVMTVVFGTTGVAGTAGVVAVHPQASTEKMIIRIVNALFIPGIVQRKTR